MKQTIRNKLRENREKDTKEQLSAMIATLEAEGYSVEFGSIGEKTTYAFLKKDEEEIVGYTFIKDLKYKNENTGKLKALQQAITRKSMLSAEE